MAATSLDFADVLRRLIPEFVVVPVRALDRPQVRPRARLTLSLAAWAGGEAAPPPASTTLELFDPPLHVRHLPAVVAARAAAPGAALRALAARLGLNYMTVKRALDYARRMAEAGSADAFHELSDRPNRASRWSRGAPLSGPAKSA